MQNLSVIEREKLNKFLNAYFSNSQKVNYRVDRVKLEDIATLKKVLLDPNFSYYSLDELANIDTMSFYLNFLYDYVIISDNRKELLIFIFDI